MVFIIIIVSSLNLQGSVAAGTKSKRILNVEAVCSACGIQTREQWRITVAQACQLLRSPSDSQSVFCSKVIIYYISNGGGGEQIL
jgi:hypothetical protein